MAHEWQWSLETYPLKKVKGIFGLPCVVRLTEGYMSEDESEEFAQGDIMTIDTEIESDKVAAMFTRGDYKPVEKAGKGGKVPDYGIISLNQPEVFLPFGYDGKLKVIKPIADVHGVKELAALFPRYAMLKETLSVKPSKGESMKIPKGTRIEIDRIIPGSTYGKENEPDRLVVRFEHSGDGEKEFAALVMNSKGKFRTEEDHAEYTISEAIDRYPLPLDVIFSSDEIKHIFEQDVSEGRRPKTKVTKSLRLNRIVKQHVLIGHYKPVAGGTDGGNDEVGATTSAGDTRKRTVIMLPVDNSEIGNIEVNIYDGNVLTIYEKLVNVQSVSEARDMVRDNLCVDFSVKPGIKLLAGTSRAYSNVSHQKNAGNAEEQITHTRNGNEDISDAPPPLPKRPAHPHKLVGAFGEGRQANLDKSSSPEAARSHYKQLPKTRTPPPKDDPDDYEKPVTSPYLEMGWKPKKDGAEPLGEQPPLLPSRKPKHTFTSLSGPTTSGKQPKQAKGKLWPSIKRSFKSNSKQSHEKAAPMPPVPEFRIEDDDLSGYEELIPFGQVNPTSQNNQPSRGFATVEGIVPNNDVLGDYEEFSGPQPVAVVKPVASDSEAPNDDNVNAEYEDIDDVIALKKQAEERSHQQRELLMRAQVQEQRANITEPSSNVSVQIGTRQNDPISHSKPAVRPQVQKPEAIVSPSRNQEPTQTHKLFVDLSNEELVERLKLCNIPDVAEICKSENLDGAFFADATVEFLKDTLNLQGLKLAKFMKMKDENWVPK